MGPFVPWTRLTMDYVLGVDVGTSSCKATLIGSSGTAFTANSEGYPLIAPQPEWAEQEPAHWREGVAESIARVCAAAGATPDEIAAIGLTGQMHSAVLLDSEGEVIRPPLLWCDQRAIAESAAGNASMPSLEDITLNPLLPAFTLAKLLWMRAHEPSGYERIQHVLLPKDLVRLWLTGEHGTDPSDAAGTALYDARQWCWSEELLDHFEIPAGWLPPLSDSGAVVGHVTDASSAEFGLRAGMPVVMGAGDQAAQAFGLGAVDAQTLALQIGTSGVIVLASDQPEMGAFCHATDGRWIRLDSMHAAGSSLLWARDVFAPDESVTTLVDEASRAAPGADGLQFLPFLMGERAGFGASTPAAFIGLQAQHRRGHFVRAVLEGVSFELRRMLDRWAIDGDGPTEVRVVGGGARSATQLQILADTFELPVVRLERDSSYGAAALAGVGVGWWDVAPPVSEAAAVRPDAENATIVRASYQRYLESYARLSGRGGA